jgi:iron(III) transport system permease protein
MTSPQSIPSRAPWHTRIRSSYAIGLLALLLAAPLLVVLSSPLHTAAPEWAFVAGELLPELLGETLLLLAAVLVVALCIAVPSAWLVTQFSFPGSRFFRWALVMPLALPTYISAYAYAALLGPTGELARWSDAHLGFRPDIVGLPGLSVVLALVLFPYIYLPARAAFTKGMGSQLDAARMLGAAAPRRFRRIALPLARPAIAGGALLLAMETLNDYGAVKYFGVRTLTTGIFRSWGGLYDLGSALRIGILMLALVAVLIAVERRSRKQQRSTTDQVPIRPKALGGKHAAAATAWCTLVLLLGAGLPIANILRDVLGGAEAGTWQNLLAAAGNTLQLAAMAAAFTLLVALLFAYRERHGRGNKLLMRVADLGYAIPGAVIAVGAMALAGAIDQRSWLQFALIGSMGLLTYAYVVRFLAVGTQPLYGALRQQAPVLDDAARLLGASPWRTFSRINLPLLRPALLAAAMLVAIDVIKELPLTLILRPFDFNTLSTRTYELASIEQLREASWPALLIVLCGLVPVLVLERVLGRRG